MTRDDVVVVPREPTGDMWSAGRRAFAAHALAFESAQTSDARMVAEDTAPAVVWKAMIAASPSASADRGGWQPIETAPKDGTWVLIAGGQSDCRWPDTIGSPPCAVARWVDIPYDEGAWCFAYYDGGFYGGWEKPTYWQPLPEPPALQQKGEET